MNIFFIGSIRGGRMQQPEYTRIVSALQKYGTVLSQFVSDEALSQYGETRLTDREIFEREIEALFACDVAFAEVTTPSLGVGYLIALATSSGKKVIALYSGEDTLKLSAMIQGNPQVAVEIYQSVDEIKKILQRHFGSVQLGHK